METGRSSKVRRRHKGGDFVELNNSFRNINFDMEFCRQDVTHYYMKFCEVYNEEIRRWGTRRGGTKTRSIIEQGINKIE